MKKLMIFPAIASALLAIFISGSVSALDMTDPENNPIVHNCASIKQSLRALQRTDARVRSYLGSSYERVLGSFITPLNLRLVSANQPNTNLTTLHSEIVDTRKDFISEYTSYAQSLDDLLASDCYGHPEDFYNKLVETRHRRDVLSTTTTNLRNLIAEHLTAVRKLKNTLGAKDVAE